MQTDLGLCPDGQYLMVEYRIGNNNTKIPTGHQWCSATDDVEAAPGTVVEPAEGQTVQIVVTLEDLQKLKVSPTKVLSANFKREGKYVGLRKQPIHMWTEAGEITRTISMLGQQVQIKLTPVSYLWDYGDGSTQTTTTGGGAVDSTFEGETKTSHAYTETGTYTAQVTVSYGGQFRVGTGEWVPVVGFLEIPSETASMDIWRKKVYPVDENCDENPNGFGCDSLFQEEGPTG
ncbi:PKD domain-containing protein [Micrococcoides hystricis]|uniref:PKD domain-containing protein n=1 Tax=Micrococcoides hystricis TaxID=1572761 RepID=A0ABV6P7G1_9MICC